MRCVCKIVCDCSAQEDTFWLNIAKPNVLSVISLRVASTYFSDEWTVRLSLSPSMKDDCTLDKIRHAFHAVVLASSTL